MKIETSIGIDAGIGTVFDAFRDLDQATDRVAGIEHIDILDGPPLLTVGTRWRETRRMFGRTAVEVMWVTEFTPHESYTVEASSNGTAYRSRYSFTIRDTNQTQVTLTFTGHPITPGAKAMSLIGPLFASPVRKALHADMTDLKHAIEIETAPPRRPQ